MSTIKYMYRLTVVTESTMCTALFNSFQECRDQFELQCVDTSNLYAYFSEIEYVTGNFTSEILLGVYSKKSKK